MKQQVRIKADRLLLNHLLRQLRAVRTLNSCSSVCCRSLGCVFYELTAQRPTFNAFNIHGLVSKIKKNKLAPLPTNYSEEWRDAIAL